MPIIWKYKGTHDVMIRTALRLNTPLQNYILSYFVLSVFYADAIQIYHINVTYMAFIDGSPDISPICNSPWLIPHVLSPVWSSASCN